MNIVIVSPGMPHDGNTMKMKSLGGSETAAIQLAEAFAKGKDAFGNRNRVMVFSPCEAMTVVNDVKYVPIQSSQAYCSGADIDLLIVSRVLDFMNGPHNAKVCMLWCHDLALKRSEAQMRGVIFHIDRILLMSEFQKQQYMKVYNLPEKGIEVIRNGIDLSLFPELRQPEDRHKGVMIYAARPERGLENLVRPGGIMDKLAKEKPEVMLMVAHYDNTTDQMRPYYESLWQRCNELPNVKLLGPLTKEKLYDLYSRSWIYCYPTPAPIMPEFDEISCISAMEAQACGLPFVTTTRGALVETVAPGTGILIPGDGNEEVVQDAFVSEIKSLWEDDHRWKEMSNSAKTASSRLGWEPVAKQLLEKADAILSQRTDDPVRLYKHFYRMSDIEMCRELERREGGERFCSGTERERQSVASDWSFTESPALYRDHYIKVDQGASVDHYATSENEPRWLVLKEFLSRTGGNYKKVLDYGCWIGHQTIRVANELPNAEVMGWDVTPNNIELAEKCKKEYSKHGNVNFGIWDEMDKDEGPVGEYDLVLLNEVLEHVLDPYKLIANAERWCKQGGTIFITTPYGPWEEMSYKTFPYRCHLRHYEMQDLLDMFQDKKEIAIFYRPTAQNDYGVPIGHHYVYYENSIEKRTGKVNTDRKMRWQGPKETVSACMIAYNAEAMLHRTLKSVQGISDEIIIAVDPKTNDTTREIAARYGARVVEGLDPMKVGFEETRNHSIKEATGDWILWIDSDEELLKPEKLWKYLRPNLLNAYAVQQHHLSVDPPMNLKPDLPMRLFRNNVGIKFYGVVHEHPEHEYNKGVGYALVLSDCWIAHDGYLTEDVRRKRFLRNIDLVIRDRKKYPDRLLGKFLWLRDLIHLCRYKMEQAKNNGSVMIDNQVIGWAKEAQTLYEDAYLENPYDPMAQDAVTYYSEANTILGKGVPVKVVIGVDGKQPTEIIARFRDSDCAAKFMHAVSKSILSPYEERYL